jgi:outer membrane protein OmpA-like peptidoglycan-associated protein
MGVIVGVSVATQAARAGEPLVGVNVGAAIPTGDFRKTADVGGMVAPFVGYRLFSAGDKFAFSLLAQPQFAAFPTAAKLRHQSDAATLFSFGVGPRLSLLDGNAELFFGAQAAYYTDISGPIDGEDGGFNLSAGFNYAFWNGTSLGLFVQRDQTTIHAASGSKEDLAFVSTGLNMVHRFLPPPPVVAQAAPPPPPLPPPPAKKRIVLRGVNFDFDRANIRSDARPILDEAISTLKENAEITIAVEGHTDSVGSDAYNQKLSVRRAKAVEEYLAKGRVDAKRMSVEGFGESRPVASNDTDDGRAQNRRVELRVTQD